MQLKGVLFDNDGTLVDTHDLILESFRHCTREVLGRVIDDETLMAGVGIPLSDQMWDYTQDPEQQEELLRVYRAFNKRFHDARVRAFEGVVDGLATLREHGIVLGVVTSKMHALAWRGLEIVGAAPYLDCCIGADDSALHKPNPDPVLQGVRALGFEPCECAYVGDSVFDMQAGNAAGCVTIAAAWGMMTREALEGESPDYIADSFDEFVELAITLS